MKRERRAKIANPSFDVEALRKALGLTQLQFAHLVPTTERTVSRWERNGLTPKGFMMRRLRKIHEELMPSANVAPKAPRPAPSMGDALREISGFLG